MQALQQVGDRGAFLALMKSAAARTGQQLVYSDIARDADVSVNTAKKWISILETSGIIHLLQPYHTNTSKRLTKSPKLLFHGYRVLCLDGWVELAGGADERVSFRGNYGNMGLRSAVP